MSNTKFKLPVIALRGLTILPNVIIHFDVSRERSVTALEKAMINDQMIFLVTQKDPDIIEPGFDELYSVGVLAKIKQLIKLPNSIVRVLVESKEKGRIINSLEGESFITAEVEVLNRLEKLPEKEAIEAMLRIIKDLLGSYALSNPKLSKEAIKGLREMKDLNNLLDQIVTHIPLYYEEKQRYLESKDIKEQYELVSRFLEFEIEVNKIKRDFQDKVKEKVENNQKEYILREQMKLIREELGEEDQVSDADVFLEQLKKLKANKAVKDKLYKEIHRFKNISSNSSESSVIRSYIETLLELPWNKCTRDNNDIKSAEIILNEAHYGLEKVKERMIEFLAVRTLTKGKGPSPIICLVGPPGTGKTSIAKSVADALNKKYVRICLGGVRDEAEIRGHRKTYVGAMPGRIATGLRQAGAKNPLMLLDEIDKLGNDYKGDPSSALLEVLDSEQNSKFRDHYVELPLDLSEVLFIATANTTQTIPRPLLDRMEIIQVTSYTENEKLHIAQEHLFNKQIIKHGLKQKQIYINKKGFEKIIQSYTKEAGVRNLERTIGELCRKAVREILETGAKAIKITDKNLEHYLGKEKYMVDLANEKDEIGLVRGLAWTSVGGDTLEIEVNITPGKGELLLTGKLGEVMQESAKAARSYVRSIAAKYDVADDYFLKHDIHMHIPEGAVPKDGPSAGITMATAILSAVTEIPVKANVAMTGEITLRGRALPIGGLKEKVLAARLAGIKTVLVPNKNRKDIDEISDEIKNGIKIVFVDTMDDVVKYALKK